MWRNAPAVAAIFLFCCPHERWPAIAAASVVPTNVWPQQKNALPNGGEIQSDSSLVRLQNEISLKPSPFLPRANNYDQPPLTKVQQVYPEIEYVQRALDPQVRQIQNWRTTQNQITNDGKVNVGNGNYSNISIYASIHEEVPSQVPIWNDIIRPINSQRFIQNIPPLPKTNEGTYPLTFDYDSWHAGVASSILPWGSVRDLHQFPARYSNSKPNINSRSNTADQETEMGISSPSNLGMFNMFNGGESSLHSDLEVPKSQNLFPSEIGIEPQSVISQTLGTPIFNTFSRSSSNSLHSETTLQSDRTNQDVHSISIQSPETISRRENMISTDIRQSPLASFNYKQKQNNYNELGKFDEQNRETNGQMADGLEYFMSNRNTQTPLYPASVTSSLPVLQGGNFGPPNNQGYRLPYAPGFFTTSNRMFPSDYGSQTAKQTGPHVSSSINSFNLENGVQERGLSNQKLHENGMQMFQDKQIRQIPESLPIHEQQYVDRLSQVLHIPMNDDLRIYPPQQIPFGQNYEYRGQTFTDSQNSKDNQIMNNAFIGPFRTSTQGKYEINPDGAWQITRGLAAVGGRAGIYPTGEMNEYGMLTEPITSSELINSKVPKDVYDKYYRDNDNQPNFDSTYFGEDHEKQAFGLLPVYSLAGNRRINVPQSSQDWTDQFKNPYAPELSNSPYRSGFRSTPLAPPTPMETNVKHTEVTDEQRGSFNELINQGDQPYSPFDDHSMFPGGYLKAMNQFPGLQNKRKNPGQPFMDGLSNNLLSDIGRTDSKSGMISNSYNLRGGTNKPAIEENFELKKNEGKLLYQDTQQGLSYSMLNARTGDGSANRMSESSTPRWKSDKTFYQILPNQLPNNPLLNPDESVINPYPDASKTIQYQGRENKRNEYEITVPYNPEPHLISPLLSEEGKYIMPNNSDKNEQSTSDMKLITIAVSTNNNTTEAYQTQTIRNELGRNNNIEETSQDQEHNKKNSFFKSPGLQISRTPSQSINTDHAYWNPSNKNGENKIHNNQYTVTVQYPEQVDTSADLEQLNGDRNMLLNVPDDGDDEAQVKDRSQQSRENALFLEQRNNTKKLTSSSTAGSDGTYFLPSTVKSEFQYEINGSAVHGGYQAAVNVTSESQNEEKSQVQTHYVLPYQISKTNREENAKQETTVELGGRRNNITKLTNKVQFYSDRQNLNANSYATPVLPDPDSMYILPQTEKEGVTASEFGEYQRLPYRYTTNFDTKRTYYDQDHVPFMSDKLHPIEISKSIDQDQSNQQSTVINQSSRSLNRYSTHLFPGASSVDRPPHLSNKDTSTLYDEYQGFPPKTKNKKLNIEVSLLPLDYDYGRLTGSRNTLTNLDYEEYTKENTDQHINEELSLKSKDGKSSTPYLTINPEKVNGHSQTVNREFDERVGITTFENQYRVAARVPSADRQQERSKISQQQIDQGITGEKNTLTTQSSISPTAHNKNFTEPPVINADHEESTKVWDYMFKYTSRKNDTDQSKGKEPYSKPSVTESDNTFRNQTKKQYTIIVHGIDRRRSKPAVVPNLIKSDLPDLGKQFAKPENIYQRIDEEPSITQPKDAKSSILYAVGLTNTETPQSSVEGFNVPNANTGDYEIQDIVDKIKPHNISFINQYDIVKEEQFKKASSAILNDTIHITPSKSVTDNQSQALHNEFERVDATTHYDQNKALSQITREGSSPVSSEHEQQEFIDKYKLPQKSAGSHYSIMNNEEIRDNFTDQLNTSSFSKPQTLENVYTSSLPGADSMSKVSHDEGTKKQNKTNIYYEDQNYLSASPAEANLVVSSLASPLKIEGSRDILEQNDKVLDSTSSSQRMLSSFTNSDSQTDRQNVVYQSIVVSASNMTNFSNYNKTILPSIDRTIQISHSSKDITDQFSTTPYDYDYNASKEGNTDQSRKEEPILTQPLPESESTYRLNPTDANYDITTQYTTNVIDEKREHSSKSTTVVSYPAKTNFSEGYEKLSGKKDLTLNTPGVTQSKFYYGTNVGYDTEQLGQYEQFLERIYNTKEDGSMPSPEHSSLTETEHQANAYEHKVPWQISDGLSPTDNRNNSEISSTDRISLTDIKDTGADRSRQKEPLLIQTSDKQFALSSLSSSDGIDSKLQVVKNKLVEDDATENRNQLIFLSQTDRTDYEATTIQYKSKLYDAARRVGSIILPIENDYETLTATPPILEGPYVRYDVGRSKHTLDKNLGLYSTSNSSETNAQMWAVNNELVKNGTTIRGGEYMPSSDSDRFSQSDYEDTTTRYQTKLYDGAWHPGNTRSPIGNDYEILAGTSSTTDTDSYAKYGGDQTQQKQPLFKQTPDNQFGLFSLSTTGGNKPVLYSAHNEQVKDGPAVNRGQYIPSSPTDRFSQTDTTTQYQAHLYEGAGQQEYTDTSVENDDRILNGNHSTLEIDSSVKYADRSKQKDKLLKQTPNKQSQTDSFTQSDYNDTTTQYQTKLYDEVRHLENTRIPIGNDFAMLAGTSSTSDIDFYVKHRGDRSKQKQPLLTQTTDNRYLSTTDETNSMIQSINNKIMNTSATANRGQYLPSPQTDRSSQTDVEYMRIPVENHYEMVSEDMKTALNTSVTISNLQIYPYVTYGADRSRQGEPFIKQTFDKQPGHSSLSSFPGTNDMLQPVNNQLGADGIVINRGKYRPSSQTERSSQTDYEDTTTQHQTKQYDGAMEQENIITQTGKILTGTSSTPEIDTYAKYGADQFRQKEPVFIKTSRKQSGRSLGGSSTVLQAVTNKEVEDVTIYRGQYKPSTETERFSQTANEETTTRYQTKQYDGATHQENTRIPIGNAYEILTEPPSTPEIYSYATYATDGFTQNQPLFIQTSYKQSGPSSLFSSGGNNFMLQGVNNELVKDGAIINRGQSSLHTDRFSQTDFEHTTTKYQTELYDGVMLQENTGTPVGNDYGVLTEDKKTVQNLSGSSSTPEIYRYVKYGADRSSQTSDNQFGPFSLPSSGGINSRLQVVGELLEDGATAVRGQYKPSSKFSSIAPSISRPPVVQNMEHEKTVGQYNVHVMYQTSNRTGPSNHQIVPIQDLIEPTYSTISSSELHSLNNRYPLSPGFDGTYMSSDQNGVGHRLKDTSDVFVDDRKRPLTKTTTLFSERKVSSPNYYDSNTSHQTKKYSDEPEKERANDVGFQFNTNVPKNNGKDKVAVYQTNPMNEHNEIKLKPYTAGIKIETGINDGIQFGDRGAENIELPRDDDYEFMLSTPKLLTKSSSTIVLENTDGRTEDTYAKNYRNHSLDHHDKIDDDQRVRLQQQVENQAPLTVMGSNQFYFQQTERSSAHSDHPDLFDSSGFQDQNNGQLKPNPPDSIITSSNSGIDRLENTDREQNTLSSLSIERERPESLNLITHIQNKTYSPVMDTLNKIRNEDRMTNNTKTDGENKVYMAAAAVASSQTTPSSILHLLVPAEIRVQKGNDYGVTEDSMAAVNDFNNSKATHIENSEATEKQITYGLTIGMNEVNEGEETNGTSSTVDVTMTQSGWKKNKNSSFAGAGRHLEPSTIPHNVSIASRGVNGRNSDDISGENLKEQERTDNNNRDGNVESIHKDLNAAQLGYTISALSGDQETHEDKTKSITDITLTQTGWMHRQNTLPKLTTDEQTANRIHSDQAQEPTVESLPEVSDSSLSNRTTLDNQQYLYYQTNSEKGAHQEETDSMESSSSFRPGSSIIPLEQNDNKGLQSLTPHESSVQRNMDESLDLNSSIQNRSKLEHLSILPVEPSASITTKNSETDARVGNNSNKPTTPSSTSTLPTERALVTNEKILSLNNLNTHAYSGQHILGEKPDDEINSPIKASTHDENKLKLSSDEPLMISAVPDRESVIRYGEQNLLLSSSRSSVPLPVAPGNDTHTGHQTITEPPDHTKKDEVRDGCPLDGGSNPTVVVNIVDSPIDEMDLISSSRPCNKGTAQSSEDILEQNERADVSSQTTTYSGQNTLREGTVKNTDLPATYSSSQNEDNANSSLITPMETLISSTASNSETKSRPDETISKEFRPTHIYQSTEPPSQDNGDALVTPGKAPNNSVELNSGSGNRSGETIPMQFRFPSSLQPVTSIDSIEPSETVHSDLSSTTDARFGVPILGKNVDESKHIPMKYPSTNDESRPSIVIPGGTSPSGILPYGETLTNDTSSSTTLKSARFADNTELNANLHGDLPSKTYTVPSTIEERISEQTTQSIKSSSQETSKLASIILDKTPKGISVGYNSGSGSSSDKTMSEQSSFSSTIQSVTSTDSTDRQEKLLNYSYSITHPYSTQETLVEDTTEYTNLPMENPSQKNHESKSTVILGESLASELTLTTATVPPHNIIVPNSGPGNRPTETTLNEPSSSILQPVESVEGMEQKGKVPSDSLTETHTYSGQHILSEDTIESTSLPIESSSKRKDEPKLPTVISSQPSNSSALHNTESKSRPTETNSYIGQSSLTVENGKHTNLPTMPPNQTEETSEVPSEVSSLPQYNSIALTSESGSHSGKKSQNASSSLRSSKYEISEGIIEPIKNVLGAPPSDSNPYSGQPTISEKTGEASNQIFKLPSQNLNQFYPPPFTIDEQNGDDLEYAKSLKTLQNINSGNFKVFTAEYFIQLIQRCKCASLNFLIPLLQKPDSGILVAS